MLRVQKSCVAGRDYPTYFVARALQQTTVARGDGWILDRSSKHKSRERRLYLSQAFRRSFGDSGSRAGKVQGVDSSFCHVARDARVPRWQRESEERTVRRAERKLRARVAGTTHTWSRWRLHASGCL